MYYKKISLFLHKISSADIVKVFSLTAISTVIKMITGLVSVKVVSIIIGPSGVALLGQLNNFSSIMMTLTCGGINGGVTKYIAEHKEEKDKLKIYLSTALKITIACSVVCSIFMIFLHKQLSHLILKSSKYGHIFIIFGVTLFLYALNNLLISILNGYKQFKKFVAVNIIGSILGLVFTLSLVYTLGLEGALIGAVTFQSIIFFITVFMIRKLPWVNKNYFKEKIDKKVVKKYLNYSLMALVTAAAVPTTQLFLRSYVILNISLTEAGWWEAMNRISSMYLMVITSSFGVYYLPRLSEIKNDVELRREIFKAYKLILPMLTIGFLMIYVLRGFVVKILFTDDFLPMTSLFIWQLIGDFFKIASWLLAFLMIAKAMTRLYVVTEILFAGLLVLFSIMLLKLNGVVGVTQAYAINYLTYLTTMIILFRKIVFNL